MVPHAPTRKYVFSSPLFVNAIFVLRNALKLHGVSVMIFHHTGLLCKRDDTMSSNIVKYPTINTSLLCKRDDTMSSNIVKYPTINSDHNWEDLCIPLRSQQMCTFSNQNTPYIPYFQHSKEGLCDHLMRRESSS